MIHLPPLDLVTAFLGAVTGVLAEVRQTVRFIARFRRRTGIASSYVTRSLDLCLDIADAEGHRAVLTRRQRVAFRVADSGVVREPVWGEGKPLAHYHVQGARRLGLRQEGMTRTVLLGLQGPTSAGEEATVRSRRTIRDGLLGTEEYLAAYLERPTAQLSLRVRFPRSRPPRAAQIVSIPATHPPRRLAARIGRDGRPLLSWRASKPAHNCTYLVRWSW